jgi:uncharacterized protein (DUF302 family)
MSFDDGIKLVTDELGKEGFGILTEIDVTNTIKMKLKKDFRKYRILGACNPPFAFKALQAEKNIGLMLPCNVVVQEIDSENIEISAIDPIESMKAIENEALSEVADEVREKLKKVIANL